MKMNWLGCASVELSINDTHLLFDPYYHYDNPTQNSLLTEAILRADAIIITHPHLDHFSDIKRILQLTSCPIYVSNRGIEIAKALHLPTTTLIAIQPYETFTIHSMTIKAYPSRHIIFDKALRNETIKRALLPKNLIRGLAIGRLNLQFSITDDAIYAYEIDNILLLGSANLNKEVTYPTHKDYLIYPFQGRSDITAYSKEIIQLLQPKQIILTHYANALPPISQSVDTHVFLQEHPNAMEALFHQEIDL